MRDLYSPTNEQLARLAPHFPRSHGKPRVDDRQVLHGIIFVNRTGCAGGMRRESTGRPPLPICRGLSFPKPLSCRPTSLPNN